MRTRRHTPQSSSSLLLDTLTNALGGIMFIALLIAVLAKQIPIETPEASPYTARKDELLKELAELPSIESLQAQIKNTQDSIRAFSEKGISPQETDKPMDQLLSQREVLQSKLANNIQKAQADVSKIPFHKIVPWQMKNGPPIIIIFKGGKVYMSHKQRPELPMGTLHSAFQSGEVFDAGGYVMDGVTKQRGNYMKMYHLITPKDPLTVEEAKKRLAGYDMYASYNPSLFMYVYEDSINEYHDFALFAFTIVPRARMLPKAEGEECIISFY